MRVAGIALGLLAIALIAAGTRAYADPLLGSSKQRIGNYDFEVATQPKNPEAGKPVTIMLRFSGVNGDDLIDVPIVARLEKDGTEVYRTDPAVVPNGHFNFEYTFPEPGRYGLYAEVTDYAYTGQKLTVTFPIVASGPIDQLAAILPAVGGVAAAALGTIFVVKRRRLAPSR